MYARVYVYEVCGFLFFICVLYLLFVDVEVNVLYVHYAVLHF
jgi:hypothetical protein